MSLPTDGIHPFTIEVVKNGIGRYESLELPLKDALNKQLIYPEIGTTWFAVSDAVFMYIFTEYTEETAKTLTKSFDGYSLELDVDTKGSVVDFRKVETGGGNEFEYLDLELYDKNDTLLKTITLNRMFNQDGSCRYFDNVYESPYYEYGADDAVLPPVNTLQYGEFGFYHCFNGIRRDGLGNYVANYIKMLMYYRKPQWFWGADRMYRASATYENYTPFNADYRLRWCGTLSFYSRSLTWIDLGTEDKCSPYWTPGSYIKVLGRGNSICLI